MEDEEKDLKNYTDNEKMDPHREWCCITDIEKQDLRTPSKYLWKTLSVTGLIVLLAGAVPSTHAILNSQASTGPITFTAAEKFDNTPLMKLELEADNGLEKNEFSKEIKAPDENGKPEDKTVPEEQDNELNKEQDEEQNEQQNEEQNEGQKNQLKEKLKESENKDKMEDKSESEAAPIEIEAQKVEVSEWYRVRRDWLDVKSQIGAFVHLEGAKATAAANPGYKVFDMNGQEIP